MCAYILVEENTRPVIPTYQTQFKPMLHIYTLWKHQKNSDFLTFSGGIEMDEWVETT